MLQDQKVPVVELVRPEGVAFTVGVIKPGHTMFSVNGKGLVGLSLADAAKVVADAAQKTKASNGSIPCIIRFLKTEVPAQVCVCVCVPACLHVCCLWFCVCLCFSIGTLLYCHFDPECELNH